MSEALSIGVLGAGPMDITDNRPLPGIDWIIAGRSVTLESDFE